MARWAWRSAFVLALISSVSLGAALYRNYSWKVPDSALPRVGFQIGDTIAGKLPNGGTLVVVSETCIACLERLHSLVDEVDRHPGDLLIVIAERENGPFKKAVQGRPSMAGRAMFFRAAEVDQYLGVQASPVSVATDASGRVLHAGYTSVGLLATTVNARGWVGRWKNLFATRVTD
ncbi:MAG TPA: hypothetical protein VGM82_21150 [Gemmatimonadaceae bacterium]